MRTGSPTKSELNELWSYLSEPERDEIANLADVVSRRSGSDLSLLNWTQRHRSELLPGVPFDLSRHKYLREPYQHQPREVIYKKSGQAGVSELLISGALWCCDELDMTGLYIFPTKEDVSDFVSARVDPAIEASDHLTRIVTESIDGRRTTDRVHLKRIGDRFLFFRGGRVKGGQPGDGDIKSGAAPQLKSVPADVIFFDEVDETDPRVFSIARKRLGHSLYKWVRAASTPTYFGAGIDDMFEDSDQRLWFVPCPSCGHRQPLDIDMCVTDWDEFKRPVHWHGKEVGEAWLACRRCGERMDRLAGGEWVATYPDREIAGYHITKLFSPFADLAQVVDNLDTLDETKAKEAWNQDLGLAYKPRGGGLTKDDLDAIKAEYLPGPAKGERTYMGIDVGAVLHVVIHGRRNRETGEIPERLATTVPTFEEAGRLLKRYNVRTCVVDANPETKKVREFQSDFRPGRVWACYYHTHRQGMKTDEPYKWDEDDGKVTADRTRTLDIMASRLLSMDDEDDAGVEAFYTLPANADSNEEYYKHMTTPVRVIEETPSGEQYARWVGKPDDYFQAKNYAHLAEKAPAPARGRGILAQGKTRGWGVGR